MSEKKIQEWKEKVHSLFDEEKKTYEYLFETLNNFYYRYLETSTDKDLTTTELAPGVWGAIANESSMLQALKITNPAAKKGIIELAKSTPRTESASVRYQLSAKVHELKANQGQILFEATIDWGFPLFQDPEKKITKTTLFKYQNLDQYRKELALKLEEVCSFFL